MVRWKYVIPRMVLFGLLCLTIWLALNPLVRLALIHGGQSVTGGRIEVAGLRALLTRSQLRLTDVAVADPQSPMKNLFQASDAVIDLDSGELLKKKLVVNEGRLTGVRLGTSRESSGALPGRDKDQAPSNGGLAEKVTQLGDRWLDQAADRLEETVEDDLQSVRLSRELMERWPREYASLEERARELRSRSEQFAGLVKQTKENPVQSIEHYQQLMGQFESLRRDAWQLRQDLARLQQQMQMDREAIAQAKEHDVQYVQEHLRVTQLDPEALSNYLLGPELGPRVHGAIQWLQWGRQYLPAKKDKRSSQDPAGRGWDVILPGMRRSPDFLVRRLALEGTGTSGQEPFDFQGTIEGLTTEPAVYGKPTVLKVQTTGAVAMQVRAVLDHSGVVSQDEIVIDCPQLVQPARTLGRPDKLAVQVAPGDSQLQIRLDLKDDALDGELRFRQPAITLQPTLSSKLGGKLVESRLAAATSAVRDLDATVRIEGTLSRPSWKLRSNLGQQLSTGLQTAVQQEAQHRQQQLMARANQELAEQIDRLEGQLTAKRDAILSELNLDTQQLDFIKRELVALGVSDKLLGQGSLLRKILNR